MAITLKLSDGDANTLSFLVDSFNGPIKVDYDKYDRSIDGTLKHYTVAFKKRWELGLNNASDSDKSTLETIYNLRAQLEFYADSAAAKTADVFWRGNFNFVPTGKHRHFRGTIWEGSIILEEV